MRSDRFVPNALEFMVVVLSRYLIHEYLSLELPVMLVE